MKWIKLIEVTEDFLGHGTVIRFPSEYPYENIVDHIVFDPLENDKGMGLLVSSGHKAGLIASILPIESGKRALNTKWLIENWDEWIFSNAPVSEAYIAKNYIAEPINS